MSDAAPDIRQQPGPHVFVASLETPVLDEADRHHLAKSLRLRDGDPLTLSDGAGSWCTARFGDALEVTGAPVRAAASAPTSLAFALTKSGKPELVVQKATEIGIDRLVIFHGERSVPRWDAPKREKSKIRLAKIAREASMQSRQTRVPSIDIVDDLDAVLAHCGADRIARADFAPAKTVAITAISAIAIGPEGGWSDAERDLISSVIDLGQSVLRAETASIVAAARLTSQRQLERPS
jgi:16S rRNA (uracil1498-N3)-methyltransferase